MADKKKKAKRNNRELFRAIFRLLKVAYNVNRWYFFFTVLTTVTIALAPILSAYFFAQILNVLVEASDVSLVVPFVVLYGVSMIVEQAAHQYYDALIYKLYRYDMSIHFIQQISLKTAQLDLEFFESPRTADLKANVRDTYDWKPPDSLMNILKIVQSTFSAVLALVSVVATFPLASVVIILTIIPSVWADFYFQSGLWGIWDTDSETRRRYSSLSEFTASEHYARDVKLLNLSEHFTNRMAELMHSFRDRQKRAEHKRSIAVILTTILPLAAISFFYL